MADLYDKYDDETIEKAYALQQHIYEEGLRGIDFTGSAENAMREVGDDI